MNNRIQQFLDAEGLTPAKFADSIGVQRSGVSHVLSGRNKPGYDFMVKMLTCYPELNAEWLLLGKGSMYKEATMPSLFAGAENEPVSSVNQNEPTPKVANAPVDVKENLTTRTQVEQAKPNRELLKVLLCYSDGSFDVFVQ